MLNKGNEIRNVINFHKRWAFMIINMKKFITIILPIVTLMILAACNNSSSESNTPAREQLKNNSSSNDDIPKTDTPANNPETKEIEEDSEVNDSKESQKDEYVKKVTATKKEMDELRNNPEDDSTYALKKVEGDRYAVWDELLNEIYGVLQKQLPSEEMQQLRSEQLEWIEYRDSTAKEASLKYEGGTMEQLEYVAVLGDLTEERCFELVEDYMK